MGVDSTYYWCFVATNPPRERDMNSVLVLEDDLSAALDIELVINEIGGLEVLRATSIEMAQSLCEDISPSIIIADLHLEDGEVSLDWLQSKAPLIPTIILTSNYSGEYYEKAQLIEARSYLMKPAKPVTLKFEIEKILKENWSKNNEDEKVVIKDGTKMHVLNSNDVFWVQTEGNYSTIQTRHRKIVIKTSLQKVLSYLDSNRFIRTHRSSIVAVNKIKMFDSKEDAITMMDGRVFPLGKTYKSEVKKQLERYRLIK